jgi:Ca2+-binding EF-hand superfamily protein
MDNDNSGKLDFEEYIISLWNICSITNDSLPMFVFKLFDSDDSGVLSHEEVDYMIHIICGNLQKKEATKQN